MLIEALSEPTVPTVTINAVSLVSKCANLTIDASGSVGNAVVVANQEDDSTTSANNFLLQLYQKMGSSLTSTIAPIIIKVDPLAAITYTISLRLVNSLGQLGLEL
jgi:hypothetical protein